MLSLCTVAYRKTILLLCLKLFVTWLQPRLSPPVRCARAGRLPHGYVQPNPLPPSLGHVSHDHFWKGGRPACIPDGRRVLPKAICSMSCCFALSTLSGRSRRSRWERSERNRRWGEKGDLVFSWHMPFSRYLQGACTAARNRFDVSVSVVGQGGTRSSRSGGEDHTTAIASSFQRSSHTQPKPEGCEAATGRPRRVSPARLSPRGGVSQWVHVWPEGVRWDQSS